MGLPHSTLLFMYALIEVRLMDFTVEHTSTIPLPLTGRTDAYLSVTLDDIRRIRGKCPYLPSRP